MHEGARRGRRTADLQQWATREDWLTSLHRQKRRRVDRPARASARQVTTLPLPFYPILLHSARTVFIAFLQARRSHFKLRLSLSFLSSLEQQKNQSSFYWKGRIYTRMTRSFPKTLPVSPCDGANRVAGARAHFLNNSYLLWFPCSSIGSHYPVHTLPGVQI